MTDEEIYLEKAKKRFWAKVKKSKDFDGCWEWDGWKNQSGVGQFFYNDKPMLPSNFIWEIFYGVIPNENRVMQRCENMGCVRPSHLFLKDVSLETRFWSKVKKGDRHDDCWEWIAYKTRHGYGRFNFNGIINLAHRIAWELIHGSIPVGMNVCHDCDNPGCVNPEHLFLGTQLDNMQDCVRKGRFCCKLKVEDVVQIRRKYAAGNISQRKLAAQYNISHQHVLVIVKRMIWKNIDIIT
jgi:hypothetical protein